MAPPDSAKVALGVLAVAGVGLVVYLLIKNRRKSSRTTETSGASDLSSSVLQEDVTRPANGEWQGASVLRTAQSGEAGDNLVPKKSASDTTPRLRGQGKLVGESVGQPQRAISGLSPGEEARRKEGDLDQDSDSDTTSAATQTTTCSSETDIRSSVSTSDVRSSPFEPIRVPSCTSLAQGDVKTDSKQSLEESPARETSPGLSEQIKQSEEKGGQEEDPKDDVVSEPPSAETPAETGGKQSEVEGASTGDNTSASEETLVAYGSKRKESAGDDVISVQSGDVSNSEPPSFEQINYSSDDVQSLEGSQNGTGGRPLGVAAGLVLQQPGTYTDTLQSQELGGGNSNTESLKSFEQISEPGDSASFVPLGSSLESRDAGSQSPLNAGSQSPLESSMVVVQPLSMEKQNGIERREQLQPDSGPVESVVKEEKDSVSLQQSQKSSWSAPLDSSMEIIQSTEKVSLDASAFTDQPTKYQSPAVLDQETTQTQQHAESPAIESAVEAPAETDGNEESTTTPMEPLPKVDSLDSFRTARMVRDGSTNGSQDFYSSDSLKSYQTARDESTTSGSQMDFYSPISSPETVDRSQEDPDTSVNKPESDSDANFQSFDMDSSDELNLDEPVASTASPQDRTPTNTPVDFAAGDDDASKPPRERSLAGKTPGKAAGEGAFTTSSETFVASLQGEENGGDTALNTGEKDVQSSPSSFALTLDKDKMTAAILQAQSGPGGLEIGHLQVLTQMLGLDDRSLVNTALQCIVRASAFTLNVNILRVCECAKELNRLLEKFAAELKNGAPVTIQGAPTAESLLLSTVRAINNLAMDIKTQPQLEGSLPLLTDLLLSEGVSESVTLATLQPLTNMSSTPAYHGHYTRILHQIYGLLDTSHNPALRLQCLKVLVNLSLNADMVPHMLAAKAPECLMELIDINCDMDLLLRTVTFLANVMAIMQEKDLTSSSLPPDEKAASPETMYAALFALDRKDALRNKVYRLTRHQSEDVCYQASRLYKYITTAK